MNQQRLMKVLLGTHVSEKATLVAEKNRQFVFKVLPSATKLEIKSAVEKLFDVKVDAVNVSNVKGKTRKFGNIDGKRKDWKKAYVSLQEGFDINFAGAE